MTYNGPRIDLRAASDDPRVSAFEREVLTFIAETDGVVLGVDDIGFPAIGYVAGTAPLTLNGLWISSGLPKPNLFHAVARLEEFGYLPDGAIR